MARLGRLGIVGAMMIVVAASCGGGDDATSATSGAQQPTTTVTTAVAPTTTSVVATTTIAPTTTLPPPVNTPEPGDAAVVSDSSARLTLRPAGSTASPLGYDEYLPPDYADGAPSPLLVFLHGYGESGDGSEAQLRYLEATGIPQHIADDEWPNERPFVVLAPQHEATGDSATYDSCDELEFSASCALAIQHDLGHPQPGSVCLTPDEVQTFLSYAIAAYDVDPERVYLTGLSCGAFAAWEYIAEYGNSQVAAVVPISGEGRPAWQTAGCELGVVPIWAFHGEADDVVDPAGSIEPIIQLEACTSPAPIEARITTYPGVGHDGSWETTYAVGAENDIYTWMLGFTHP